MRFLCSSSLALSSVVPSPMVMSFLVIIALTGWSRLRSKRMSRLVRMPTGAPVGRDHRQPRDAVPLHQLDGGRQLLVGRRR